MILSFNKPATNYFHETVGITSSFRKVATVIVLAVVTTNNGVCYIMIRL